MIELINDTKIYFTSKGKQDKGLNSINIKLPNKGLLAILGKSGSGKNTLLNTLGGLDKITSKI